MSHDVLFIEDDDYIRDLLSMSLHREGYEVHGARSGEDGIKLLNAQEADIVLVDLRLPGIDGFEVTRTIRRHSAVPIIMVTGSTDTYDVVAGLEAGADDYVTKPVVAKELGARIRGAAATDHRECTGGDHAACSGPCHQP